MRAKMNRYICLALLLIGSFAHAQHEALFNAGKEAYKEGTYREAISDWKQILDSGAHSASLYFNLGNAYYKLNEIGPSIYYYEKALQLSPGDSDIKNNLAFAENARIDAIEPLPRTVFAVWYKKVSGIYSFEAWAVVTICFSSLFVLLFLLYYFSASETRKRALFVGALFSIFLSVVTLALSFMTHRDAVRDQPAIIFAESVEVRDAPSVGGETSFIIHEGTKVQLLEEDSDWARVKLIDGKDGWIPKTSMKPL